MKTLNYCFAILLTTALLEQTCQSSFAFNIKGQTTSQSLSVQAAIPDLNAFGTVTVRTKRIRSLRRGGEPDFLNVLRSSYSQNFRFIEGNRLPGDFNVRFYNPCPPFVVQCGADIAQENPGTPFSIRSDGVGASISVDYEPGNLTGRPQVTNVGWIQRAIVNTGGQTIKIRIAGSDISDSMFDLIDTQSIFPNPPFYPGAFLRQNPSTGFPSYSFYDRPYNATQNPKPSFLYDNDWTFQLYMVSPAGVVDSLPAYRIHNGISWGFKSKFTPCVPSSGGGGCVTGTSTRVASASVNSQGLDNNSTATFGLNNASLTMADTDIADLSADLLDDPELSSEDSNSLAAKNADDALATEAVPEPITAAGTLLALGGLSLLAKLKNRSSKKQ